jgi:hypothetical protein
MGARMSRYRQRRRTRYLARLEKAGVTRERAILAYDPESVRSFYARQGYNVLSVERVKPTRSARPTNAPWRLDERAIQEARDFLGITKPISIKVLNHASRNWGEHRVTVGPHGVRQTIAVKRWLSPEDASRTLWHELTHAMQTERALARIPAGLSGRETIAHLQRQPERGYRSVRYEDKPIEQEAREHEAMHDVLPLAVAV